MSIFKGLLKTLSDEKPEFPPVEIIKIPCDLKKEYKEEKSDSSYGMISAVDYYYIEDDGSYMMQKHRYLSFKEYSELRKTKTVPELVKEANKRYSRTLQMEGYH